jgi:hypothetical protein
VFISQLHRDGSSIVVCVCFSTGTCLAPLPGIELFRFKASCHIILTSGVNIPAFLRKSAIIYEKSEGGTSVFLAQTVSKDPTQTKHER